MRKNNELNDAENGNENESVKKIEWTEADNQEANKQGWRLFALIGTYFLVCGNYVNHPKDCNADKHWAHIKDNIDKSPVCEKAYLLLTRQAMIHSAPIAVWR